ncbi:MAG TPA: HAMP domain-containing sensor histidine kinase [Devosia sp.]|uniref:sensor histidine kinase n=1 Tax=Devosia sp. TaxID=1871048 RepID=UPI002DDD029C|nr:HAMP domain-containing sensor histidine kinase [Devosia sp.]HEV2516137.1 HAMP domain-containing sensor histidine kinase [Devosia sp.]
MNRRPSIALQLALGLSAGMALLWIGAATISVAVMQHELNEAYDDSLRESALRLLPLAVHDLRERDHGAERLIVGNGRADGDGDDDDDDHAPARVAHDASFTYFIRDAAGALVLRDEHAPDDIDVTEPVGFGDLNGQRTFALQDPRSGYSIVIVELSDRRATAFRDSLAALGWPLLALIPLIAAGVWLAMRLALRPLQALRRDIAQRDSRNLEPLHADRHPIELAPIADAVGELLARLKSALEAERAFAARSAHELRTPIAGALAQTQQLADELAGKPGIERVREIETALKRLSQLSEKLLQLARIEAGFARTDNEIDQLPVLNMVIRDINASTAWRDRVQFETGSAQHLPATIDPDGLAIVLRNLIENALKHGRQAAPVRVFIAPSGSLHIQNQGPALDPVELAQLGRPFVRGETTADGSGLGLSIARGIIGQAGGRLTLQSPIAGLDSGVEAVVDLPRRVAQ